MRFVVALMACMAAWSTIAFAALALPLVGALALSVPAVEPSLDRRLDVSRALLILLGSIAAGAAAWVATRRISGLVEGHADGRFGAEPVITAAALGIMPVFQFVSNDDVRVLAWGLVASFAAAFVSTFVPWHPRRPSLAGVLVGTATLIVLWLNVYA